MARAMPFIESAKMNNLEPQAYLTDLSTAFTIYKINRIDELLPWNRRPLAPVEESV